MSSHSLLAVPVDYLVTLARHPMASRLLDCALTLPSIAGKYRRRLILRLLGHYHLLADDRIGSHVVDKAWAAADVYLKEKIAASLLDHLLVLQASRTGHFFARTAQLALFERRPAEWKAKMISAAAPPAPVPASAPEIAVVRSPAVADGAEGKKEKKRRKRREDEPDEVDAIFAAVAGPKRIRV
jgi:nucleolar protein 9